VISRWCDYYNGRRIEGDRRPSSVVSSR
jgi:hypothetical protein